VDFLARRRNSVVDRDRDRRTCCHQLSDGQLSEQQPDVAGRPPCGGPVCPAVVPYLGQTRTRERCANNPATIIVNVSKVGAVKHG
jgi:hypothetical protein